jgi:hypothetical protein
MILVTVEIRIKIWRKHNMAVQRERIDYVELSRGAKLSIYEIHETTSDGRDWLNTVIRYLNQFQSSQNQRIKDMFSKASSCSIDGCQELVTAGAHVTIDGTQVLIVPTCAYHNGVGNLDRLGRLSRLKPYSAYAYINLQPGMMIQNDDGIFHLVQALSMDNIF